MVLGHTYGDFFTNASGHPDCMHVLTSKPLRFLYLPFLTFELNLRLGLLRFVCKHDFEYFTTFC
jgi:hypothetical protein